MKQCRVKCFQYNNTSPDDIETKDRLIREILGFCGEKIQVHSPFLCDRGFNIHVGENFFANYNLVIVDGASVTFGDNVLIAPNCGFYTNAHPIVPEQRKEMEYAYPITVGNDVWFGAGVQVMPGVTIGDGSVIGAGSVVTRDIPAGVVAYGNPCKVVRPITDDDKLGFGLLLGR